MDKLKGIICEARLTKWEDEYRLKKKVMENMRMYMTVDISFTPPTIVPCASSGLYRILRPQAGQRRSSGHPKKSTKRYSTKILIPPGYTTWIHSIIMRSTMPPWKNMGLIRTIHATDHA